MVMDKYSANGVTSLSWKNKSFESQFRVERNNTTLHRRCGVGVYIRLPTPVFDLFRLRFLHLNFFKSDFKVFVCIIFLWMYKQPQKCTEQEFWFMMGWWIGFFMPLIIILISRILIENIIWFWSKCK